MSTTELLIVVAIGWPAVGLIVSVLLGSILRKANVGPDEFENRLIC